MVLCADGHRRGWNLSGTIRSNQSEKKTDSFISLSFIMLFLAWMLGKEVSVFTNQILPSTTSICSELKRADSCPRSVTEQQRGIKTCSRPNNTQPMWDCTLSFNVSSKVTLSIFQFSPSQTFRLRQTHRQSVFNKGIFDYQSQSPLLQAKLVHLRKIQFLGIYNQRQEKDFGQKLLMYKIQHDGYTSLYYSAQLKFTLWKG